MRIQTLALIMSLARCVVKETALEVFSLDSPGARVFYGKKEPGGGWMLRSGVRGAAVTFRDPNPNDEWSVEVEFDDPGLKYPQYAGIFLWYTDTPVLPGDFKGGQGQFNGIVTGMEFVGKNVDFIVGVNHGEVNFAALGAGAVLTDSPDPEHFKGQKKFTMKVISTEKNFKLEIYGDEGKLLYDRLRFTKATTLGDRMRGKYFGITAEYAKVPEDRGIKMTKVRVNSREELETYDPELVHSELPSPEPRMPKDVGHSDEEVRYVISGIEHLSKYLRVILGDPQVKPIAENISYLKKTLNFQSAQIMDLRSLLFHEMDAWRKKEAEDAVARTETRAALQEVAAKTVEAHGRMTSKTLESRASKGISVLTWGASVSGAFVIGYLLGSRQSKQMLLSQLSFKSS